MKLRARLTALCQSISINEFQHIWDCCCDHGYLGQQLMTDHPNSQIHFVDVVPHLIAEVEDRLNASTNSLANNWAAHCMDAATIRLDDKQTHLVIIAGVGGDLLIEMVQDIVSNHSATANRIDFLLCPVRQLHKVREGLNTLELGLISEQIVKDNHLFYEVIQVSNQSASPVSLIGCEMWNLSEHEHIEYRDTMICHYEKQPSDQAQRLLKLYEAIK